jgi:DNA-directed RNA polymerase specialized sigma24 family protein
VRERFGRRRLPASIRRLPELEQEVFRQLYWKDCVEDELAGVLAQRQLPHSPADIARAVAAVRSALGANRVNRFGAGDTVIPLPQPGDPDEIEDKYPTPDEDVIIRHAQAALDRASDRLRVAIGGLPAEMQCYAKLRFWDDLPPREIARVMNVSVTEIYRLRDKAEHMLELSLGADEDVQKWRQAV